MLVASGSAAFAQAPPPAAAASMTGEAAIAAAASGTIPLPAASAASMASAPASATAVAATPPPITKPSFVAQDTLNGADTAWMMTSTALVLLMTLPGIAFFYAGMVRKKSVINTMACVVGVASVVTIAWFAAGYSWAFTPGSPWLGGGSRLWFAGLDYVKDGKVMASHIAPNIPESVYSMFQLTFAIITAALVIGSFVERMKFSAMLWFIGLWSLFVYAPVAHWVWEPGGWLAQLGALDFAGGSVVHINAGMSGLVCAYFLGPRRGYGREAFEPFNLGLTMAGAGMLWVGWFGFNAGSAVASDGRAGLAMAVTQIAAAAGALSWMLAEWIVRSRPSLLGLCSGLVAGLVAITPASGFVTPASALLIGAVGGVTCYWGATSLKRLLRADDSLDVFGVHGIGGIVGCLMTGLLASKSVSGVHGSVTVQMVDAMAVLAYSGIMTAVLLAVTKFIVGLRADENSELAGLDISQHRERIAS
jgi:Amt family ammonium transporter